MDTIAAVMRGYDDDAVQAATRSVADLMGLTPTPLAVPPRRRDAMAALLAAAEAPEVATVALSASDPLCDAAMTALGKPLLVVPPGARPSRHVRCVLVPLDGDRRTTAAVRDVLERAADAGVRTVPLHVFDAHTTPAFWDQAAHARRAWGEEFRQRHVPSGEAVDLRRGEPAEEVAAAVEGEGADLVVIGWHRKLSEGHARVVRELVHGGAAPVLLLGSPAPSSGRAARPSP